MRKLWPHKCKIGFQKGIVPVTRMRKTLLLLFTFAIVVTTARAVSASTDCQRWLADYKNALAQKADMQRLLAAKHRAHAYAHRKIAQLTTAAPTAPHPTRIANTRPHLTPVQMLKRFDLLCGELPVDPTPQVLDARMTPDELISELAAGEPVDVDTLPADSTLVAENNTPFYEGPSATGEVPSVSPYMPTYGPVPGGGGFPGVTPVVPPVVPPIAPVPEPSSMVLLLTGSAGAFGMLRRRLAR